MGKVIAMLMILCFVGISPATYAQANVVADRFNTSQLFKRSIDGYKDCINYCVVKLEIRVEYTGVSVNVYVVPVIQHNNPDMLVMTNRLLAEEAYSEWAKVSGGLQKAIQQAELSLTTGMLVEAHGGQTEYSQFGHQQSTSFAESEIIGNPGIIPSQYYGMEPYFIVGHGSGRNNAGEYGSFNKKYNAFIGIVKNGFSTAAIANQALNYFGISGYLKQFKDLVSTAEAISDIVAGDAGFGGAGFQADAYMCKSKATSFWPYYLSSVDSIFWRSGYPIVDLAHTNKFFTLENQVRPSSSLPIEDWGWVYPRVGFINSDHSARSAAVLTKRAAAVAGDGRTKVRLRTQTPNSHIYQKMSPDWGKSCSSNIADLSAELDANHAYAYNLWVRYECTTSKRGVRVATIDIPDICL